VAFTTQIIIANGNNLIKRNSGTRKIRVPEILCVSFISYLPIGYIIMAGGAGNYIAGVIIALFTTFSSALGLVLQKLSHNNKSSTTTKRIDKTFMAGVSLMALSAIVSLAVFALCGQAVASSFATLTIVWSLLLSAIILKEPILYIDIIVCTTLIIGAIISIVFGSKVPRVDSSSPSTVRLNLSSTRFIITMSVLAVLGLCSTLLTVSLARRKKVLTVAGLRLACLSSIVVACVFCGLTGTMSTSFVGLIAYAFTTSASEVFTFVPLYFIFLSLIASLVLQITFLNKALKLRPNNEVVPIYQSGVCIVGVAMGLLIFGEGPAVAADLAGFSCGIVLCVCGLLMLGFKKKSESPLSELIEQLLLDHEVIITRHRRTQSCPPLPIRDKNVTFIQRRVKAEERNLHTERAPTHRSRATLAAAVLTGMKEYSKEEDDDEEEEKEEEGNNEEHHHHRHHHPQEQEFNLPSPILRRLSLSPRLLRSALRAKQFRRENRPKSQLERITNSVNKPALVIPSSAASCVPSSSNVALCRSVPVSGPVPVVLV